MSAVRKKATKRTPKKPARSTTKRTPKPKPIPVDWMTQAAAARFCRVAVQVFQRYGLEPVERRGRCTYYTQAQLLDWIEERGRRKGYEAGLIEGRKAVPEDAAELLTKQAQAELDWTRERAEGQRLKNTQMRRELAPVAMVSWAISQAGSQIAAVLGTIKGRVKRAQPNLSNDALHELEQAVVEAQNAAAEVRLDWDEFDDADLSDPRVD